MLPLLRTSLAAVVLYAALALGAVLPSAPVHAQDEVRLLASRSFDCPPVSGCFKNPYVLGVVEVANLAHAKRVTVVYLDHWSETWEEVEARYLGPATEGRELWTFRVEASVRRFAIRYRVGGQEYWDNNGGRDYDGGHYLDDSATVAASGLFAGPELYAAPAYAMDEGTLEGTVFARAALADATVQVVYTDDGWETVKVVEATPSRTYDHGWFGHDTAGFTFTAPIREGALPSEIEFAVVLVEGDRELWDSNFGRNYGISEEAAPTSDGRVLFEAVRR